MRARPGRRRAVAVLSGALALVLALAGCSASTVVQINTPAQVDAALPADTAQQLQDAVTRAMAATGSPGAIVGVWAPWSGTFIQGLGTQTPGGAAVTAQDEFRAGRMTRAMTCDVLFELAAAGTVSRDDPVTKWVSGVAGLTDHGITLGQLCDSTSGLGSYGPQLLGEWLNNPARSWNPHELASYGVSQQLDPAGAAFKDSDTGYLLLGLALERASGKTAAQLLQEYVFAPLALGSTSLPSGSVAATGASAVLSGNLSMKDAAGALACAAPLDVTALSSSTGFTDSGVATNILDLGRYARALAAGTLVPADAGRFTDPLAPAAGAPSWFTTKGGAYLAGSLVGQYGSTPGYLTAAFADPATGLTVAVVLNNSAADPGMIAALAWELAAIASKAPPVSGSTTPEAGLPWTAQQFADQITASAVCAAPAK